MSVPTILRLGVAALATGASVAAAAPAAPPRANVVPRYGSPPSIMVRWLDLPDEDYYEVWRGVYGGGLTVLATVAAKSATGEVVEYQDTTIDPETRYQYLVRACTGAGDCLDGRVFTTSARIVWPIDGGHEMLHGFNEVLAWAGVRGTDDRNVGFHDGIDLGRTTTGDDTPGDQVLAPLGGIVSFVGPNPNVPDNAAVEVGFETGTGKLEYYQFNHLMNAFGFTPLVRVNDTVEPGQQLGYVGVRHFKGDLPDHVHLNVYRAGRAADAGSNARSPLMVFRDPADRDPQGQAPALFDENGDGKVVLFRSHQEADPTKYLEYDHDTKPLSGDIDIHVEVTDRQGTLPRQAPIQLGYWIEGPLPPSQGRDDVKSAARPYKLYDFRTTYFGAGTPPTGCSLIADILDVANAGCKGLTDCVTDPPAGHVCHSTITEGPLDFPWPILHHFKITHAAAEDGAPANVKATQYWRTQAFDDRAEPTSTHANYADRPLALTPTDARFPDGDYTIHVVASDLVHENVDLPIRNIRLENWTPFIKEIAVYADADGNPSSQSSADFPACETELYRYVHPGNPAPYPGPGYLEASQRSTFARAGEKLCVKVRFSESMAAASVTVALDPQGAAGAPPLPFSGAFARTFNPDDTWMGTLIVPLDPSGDSDSSPASHDTDAVLRVTGRDLPDRTGAQRGMDADADGVPEPSGADENHMIKLDASTPMTAITATKQT
jgi:murein DD-endopeptidase MepM/ murein hydrolase activator NlpD